MCVGSQEFGVFRHSCTSLAFDLDETLFSVGLHGTECFEAMQQDSRKVLDADGQVLVFTDEADRAWEVREIRDPVLPERRKFLLGSEYARGWLLFMSGEERRRLAPFPPGWRLADAAQLRCWVNDALPVRWVGAARTPDRVHDLPPVTESARDPV